MFLRDVDFLIKSHVWANLVNMGSILGGFGTPNWHFLVTKNQTKNWSFLGSIFYRFWSHLGSQNDPKILPPVCRTLAQRVFFGVLEPTWYPKRIQEGFKAPKNSQKWPPRLVVWWFLRLVQLLLMHMWLRFSNFKKETNIIKQRIKEQTPSNKDVPGLAVCAERLINK